MRDTKPIDAIRLPATLRAAALISGTCYIDPGEVLISRAVADAAPPESVIPCIAAHLKLDLEDETVLEEVYDALALIEEGGPEAEGARAVTAWRPRALGVNLPEGTDTSDPAALIAALSEALAGGPPRLLPQGFVVASVPGVRTVACLPEELPRAGLPMVRILEQGEEVDDGTA